jgi:hypothetical protein
MSQTAVLARLTPLSTVLPVPRKRRDDRPKDRVLSRINVEVYDDELEVVAQAKAAAVRQRTTFRAWVLNAMREQAAREARGGAE